MSNVRPHKHPRVSANEMATNNLPSILQILIEQHAPPSHLRRIEALCALSQRTPSCLGLALVGSYAKHLGDRISDLDLVAFFSDGTAEAYIEKAHRLLCSEEVVSAYSGNLRTEGFFWKYVFLDFSSCELYALNQPATLKLHRPYLAIWDPNGFLATLEVEEPPPRHEEFDAYQHGDEGLLWELFDCVKWLKRGRIELTENYLRKLVNKLPPE